MESLLEVSYVILMVGGALCILLLFLVLVYILSLLIKTKRLVKQVEQTYQQAMMITTLPFKKLTEWLWSGEDEDEDR